MSERPEFIPPGWAVIGMKFRLDYDDRLRHVRGHVDERIIVRWWSKTRQHWIYEFLDEPWFIVNEKHVRLVQ